MWDKSQATCWVVTDGKAGMENQCLGLAEGVGIAASCKADQIACALAATLAFSTAWSAMGL